MVDDIFSSSTKDHTIKQKMLDSYNQTTTKMMEQNYQTKNDRSYHPTNNDHVIKQKMIIIF